MNSKNSKKQKWINLEFDFCEEFKKPKPQTDNEKIHQFELDYRANTKDGAKNLFLAMRSCAKRFVYHERKMKGFYISSEDVMEKATMAAEYVMEQYIKRPDFSLKVPSAYIRLRVLAALYRHKKIEEYIAYTDEEM